MKKLNTYLNLCTEVYDLSKPKPPSDAYAFYRDYVVHANGTVLEPMCGTGRYLLPLLEEGFAIEGFDASQSMLDALHAKAKAKKLSPDVYKGFVEDLNRVEKYGLIYIPAGSFGLLTDIEEGQSALKTFYEYLNSGGILVFEAETLRAIPTQFGTWHSSVWRKDNGQMILTNFLNLPMEDNVSTSICRYELVDKNNILRTEIEEIKVRYYEVLSHLIK